jgi:hypothetical protein
MKNAQHTAISLCPCDIAPAQQDGQTGKQHPRTHSLTFTHTATRLRTVAYIATPPPEVSFLHTNEDCIQFGSNQKC